MQVSTYLVGEPHLRLDLHRALHLAGLGDRDLVLGHATVLGRAALAVQQRLLLLGLGASMVDQVRRTLIQTGQVAAVRRRRSLGSRHGRRHSRSDPAGRSIDTAVG